MTMRRVRSIIGISSIALALASLSVVYERRSDEVAVVGNVCGPSTNEACVERRLAAGFPLAYMYDRPSISVPGTIHFVEDEFRALPFALNILIYLGVLVLLFRFIEWRRGRPAFEPVERTVVSASEAYEGERESPRSGRRGAS